MKKTTKIKENGEVVSNNFIQLTNTKAFIKLMKENAQAAAVFLFLADKMTNRGAVIVSQNTIANLLDMSRSTIIRHMNFLIENKYIKSVRTGGSNIYYINEQIAWKGYGKDRQFAEFSANVILGLDEQSEDYKKQILASISKK